MYPEITLQLYDGEQHELMHGLHRGRFDLALVYDPNWVTPFIKSC